MQLFKTFHLMLAFTLELALLAALGYWGFHNRKMPEKYLLGVGAPILAVILWWIWAAPKSASRLQQPGLLLFKISLFGLAAFGLYRSGQSGPGGVVMKSVKTGFAIYWLSSSCCFRAWADHFPHLSCK